MVQRLCGRNATKIQQEGSPKIVLWVSDYRVRGGWNLGTVLTFFFSEQGPAYIGMVHVSQTVKYT